MNRTLGATVVVLTLVGAVIPAEAGQTAGEGWTLPRTPDGRPDFQGVWANNNVTPLERPEQWAGKQRLTAEELAELKAAAARVVESGLDAQFGDQLVLKALAGLTDADSYDTTGNYNQFWMVERDFTNQTSLVVDPADGQVPPLTVGARQRAAAAAAYRDGHPADGPEDRPLGERCANFGVPRLGAGYNSYVQIFQTPDHIALFKEMAHDVKLIPLDGSPHVPGTVRQWNGDSRGRWEGDTLVVETGNFSAKSDFRGSAEGLHLVERYTRTGPETLTYEVTIADSTVWTQPWTVLIQLRYSPDPIFEYACHEGNYGMEGILAGHRAEERNGDTTSTESH
jgi:hypothetical protein